MSRVFDVAMRSLFRDGNMATSAIFHSLGYGTTLSLKVLASQPDVRQEWNGVNILSPSLVIRVRMADVAEIAPGDTFTIGAVVYAIQGQPERDVEAMVWTVELVPAP